jgi:hypothetical protein
MMAAFLPEVQSHNLGFLSQAPLQYSFLRVQAALGFVEHYALRAAGAGLAELHRDQVEILRNHPQVDKLHGVR